MPTEASPLLAPVIPEGARVGILGAGAIGLYVGGLLQSQGIDVLFVGRSVLRRTAEAPQLLITDFSQPDLQVRLPREKLNFAYEPSALSEATPPLSAVFVCVKSGDTASASALRALPKDCVVISLQNGVDNVQLLREMLPGRTVVAGMVPFGVNELEAGHFHRGTAGALAFGPGIPAWLIASMQAALLPAEQHSAQIMDAMQWFKLVVNLQNALNALVGTGLGECLQSRAYRRLMGCCWEEGIAACAAAGITLHGDVNGRGIASSARLLTLPNCIFLRVAKPVGEYRSSMFADLDQRRTTEVRHLQGRIVELGEKHGVKCPVNALLLRLIEEAERKNAGSPNMVPAEIERQATAVGARLRRLPEDYALPAAVLVVLIAGTMGFVYPRL